MTNVASIFLHTASVGVFGYGIANTLFSDRPLDTWIRSQYGGHFQYLTILGLLITTAAAVIGFLTDVFPSRGLRSAKRALLMTAMPLEAVIAGIYWTLLTFFPALILKEDIVAPAVEVLTNTTAAAAEAISPPLATIPLPVDLAIHAFPGLVLVLDFLFFEEKFGVKSADNAAPVVCLQTFIYAWWAELCGDINGSFPYPFLTLSPFEVRLTIYAGATLLAYCSFLTLNALHP